MMSNRVLYLNYQSVSVVILKFGWLRGPVTKIRDDCKHTTLDYYENRWTTLTTHPPQSFLRPQNALQYSVSYPLDLWCGAEH